MKKSLKNLVFGVLLLLLMSGAGWVVLKTAGHYAIRLAYENRFPVRALNAVISDEGRRLHDAGHYGRLADSFYGTYVPRLIGWSLLVVALFHLVRAVAAKSVAWRPRVFAMAFFILGLLLLPPVARRLLSTGPWAPEVGGTLWWVSIPWVLLSGLAWRARPRIPDGLKKVLAVLLLALAAEFGFRLVVRAAMPGLRQELHHYGIRTYFYSYVIEGHPFLQYSPKPGVVSDRNLMVPPSEEAGWKAYRQGLRHPKPPGAIRIVALGGSTVASGWPNRMLEQMNVRAGTARFEVINYGVAWYNSAHMLVNFALNALHYDPDYVILHEAWNDSICRNTDPAAFRTDYSHVLTPFHEPEIPDLQAIRISAIYRFARMRATPYPFWWDIIAVLTRPRPPSSADPWALEEELIPYRSNYQAILELAQARGVRVVLTTQPYSTLPMRQADVAPHVEQCNAIVRDLAREWGDRVVFVDLAAEFKDRWDEHFIDLGHVDEAADLEKARLVGEAIERDRLRRESSKPSPWIQSIGE